MEEQTIKSSNEITSDNILRVLDEMIDYYNSIKTVSPSGRMIVMSAEDYIKFKHASSALSKRKIANPNSFQKFNVSIQTYLNEHNICLHAWRNHPDKINYKVSYIGNSKNKK